MVGNAEFLFRSAVILILAVVLSGCGGTDPVVDPKPTASNRPAPVAPPPAPAPAPVPTRPAPAVVPQNPPQPARTVAPHPLGTKVALSEPVDVLQRINLGTDSIQGEFQVKEGALIVPYVRQSPSYLSIPVDLPDEYVVEIEVERLQGDGGLGVGLQAAGRRFLLEIDGNGGEVSGMHLIDGKFVGENETAWFNPLIWEDEITRVTYMVHKGGVRAVVDGTTIYDWQGDFKRLSLPQVWDKSPDAAWFIGSWQARFRVRKFELRPLGQIPPPDPRRWLTQMSERNVRVGFGKFGKWGELGIGDEYICLHTIFYDRSIGMFPDGEVSYELGGKYRSFRALAAMSQSTGRPERPVLFEVYGDGKRLWQSKELRHASERHPCEIDVSNVQTLTLKTRYRPGTQGHGNMAHAVWIDPYVDTRPVADRTRLTRRRPGRKPTTSGKDILTFLGASAFAIDGEWGFDGDSLSTPYRYGRMHLPCVPPEKYELTAVVELVQGTGSIAIGLPVGKQRIQLTIDATSAKLGPVLENKSPDQTRRETRVFQTGAPTTITCRVDPDEVQTKVNGKPLVSWKRENGGLKYWIAHDIPRIDVPSLVVQEAQFRVHQLNLRPLDFNAALAADTDSRNEEFRETDYWSQDLTLARSRAFQQNKDVMLLIDKRDEAAETCRTIASVAAKFDDRSVVAHCPCDTMLESNGKVIDGERSNRIMRQYELIIYELPLILMTDSLGNVFASVSPSGLSEADLSQQLAEAFALRSKRDELFAGLDEAQPEARVRAAVVAADFLNEHGLGRFYTVRLKTWLEWTLDVDPRNELGLQEALFEANFCLNIYNYHEAKRGFPRGVEKVTELAQSLNGFRESRGFKDPDRGARLHLRAAEMLDWIGDNNRAKHMREQAANFKPRDPDLATKLKAPAPEPIHPRQSGKSGSGFVVAQGGYVLTNWHVVNGVKKLTVRLPKDDQVVLAKVVAKNADKDIALLKVELPSGHKLPPLPISNVELERGDAVAAFGYPLGTIVGNELKLTTGTVSATETKFDMLLLDCRVNPGNSGGPLCNTHGHVVGMVTAKSTSGFGVDSYGMALPADDLVEFLTNSLPFKYSAIRSPPGRGKDWKEVDRRVNQSVLMVMEAP